MNKFNEFAQSTNTQENCLAQEILAELVQADNNWGRGRLIELVQSVSASDKKIAGQVSGIVLYTNQNPSRVSFINNLLQQPERELFKAYTYNTILSLNQIETRANITENEKNNFASLLKMIGENFSAMIPDEITEKEAYNNLMNNDALMTQLIKGSLLLKENWKQELFLIKKIVWLLKNPQKNEHEKTKLYNILSDIFDKKEAWERAYWPLHTFLAENSLDSEMRQILSILENLSGRNVIAIAKTETRYKLKQSLEDGRFGDISFAFN